VISVWLAALQAKVQHLVALARVAPRERVHQLQLLSRPQAVLAAHERVFALTAGHALLCVTTRASLQIRSAPRSADHCWLAAPPLLIGAPIA